MRCVDVSAGRVVLAHHPLDETRVITVDGETVDEVPPPSQAHPPYLVTYVMELQRGQWILIELSSDGTRTCTGDA